MLNKQEELPRVKGTLEWEKRDNSYLSQHNLLTILETYNDNLTNSVESISRRSCYHKYNCVSKSLFSCITSKTQQNPLYTFIFLQCIYCTWGQRKLCGYMMTKIYVCNMGHVSKSISYLPFDLFGIFPNILHSMHWD